MRATVEDLQVQFGNRKAETPVAQRQFSTKPNVQQNVRGSQGVWFTDGVFDVPVLVDQRLHEIVVRVEISTFEVVKEDSTRKIFTLVRVWNS